MCKNQRHGSYSLYQVFERQIDSLYDMIRFTTHFAIVECLICILDVSNLSCLPLG